MARLLLVVLITLLSACAQNSAFRSKDTIYILPGNGVVAPPEARSKENSSIVEVVRDGDENRYSITFIEFDDQGALFDVKLKNSALEYLKSQTKERSLVVIFTHGWHHSASSKDGNVASFRNLLSNLAKKHEDLNVVGVYMGWRGDSVKLKYANVMTVWDRKESAHKVGAGAAPVFSQIEDIVKNQNRNDNLLVTIGHSFGGAVTYTALAPILQERYLRDRRISQDQIRGFGDLVVLMNPAFEAQLHLPFFNLVQETCSNFSDEQKQRLVIITSDSDLPVRWTFPITRFISSFGDRQRDDGQILICHSPNTAPEIMTVRQGGRAGSARTSPGALGATVTHCIEEDDGDIIFKYKGTVVPNNPYLVFSVSKKLIADHNDIWGEIPINLVTALIDNRLTARAAFVMPDKRYGVSECPVVDGNYGRLRFDH